MVRQSIEVLISNVSFFLWHNIIFYAMLVFVQMDTNKYRKVWRYEGGNQNP